MKKNDQKFFGGWISDKLGGFLVLKKGLTYKSSDYGDVWSGVPFFTLKSILKGGGFNIDGLKFFQSPYSKKDIVRPNDLVIANTDLTRDGDVVGAPMFIPNMSDGDMLVSMDLSVLQPNETKLNKKFLYYYLSQQYIREYMRGISGGSTVLHLNTNHVSKLKIKIPSDIREQEKIADILGAVDENIEKTEKLIQETETLKRGLMQQFFIKGIGHIKFKKTKLGEVALIVRGGSPRPIESYITKDVSGLNWLRIGDIDMEDKYIYRTTDKITREGLKKTTQVYPGDLILSNSMSFGRPYLMKIDACIHDGWLAFRNIKKDTYPEYLYYLLSSYEIQKIFYSLAVGSGVKNLKRESVSMIEVQIPDFTIQKKIVEILSIVDAKITINKELKTKLADLKKGLLSDLLSGVVRV